MRTLVLLLLCFSCQAASFFQMRPTLGDARVSRQLANIPFPVVDSETGHTNRIAPIIQIAPPVGNFGGVTFCFWTRVFRPDGSASPYGYAPALHLNYTPATLPLPSEDLASGAFGYPSGTNLTGTISVPFEFLQTQTNVPAAVFSRGVYTAIGGSSNVVTLTAGGRDWTLGPGEFASNFEPGPSDGLILSGSGPVSIRISRPHIHEFFGGFQIRSSSETTSFEQDSTFSNELCFVSVRLQMTSSNQVIQTTLLRPDWSGLFAVTNLTTLPKESAIRHYSSSGIFQFSLVSVAPHPSAIADLFDMRSFGRFLSDSELERIYLNGQEEFRRRNIPRWRTP